SLILKKISSDSADFRLPHRPSIGQKDYTLDRYRACGDRAENRYCWRIYFKVLEVLFLASVSHAFLPSKQACGIHKFRHFGIRQQYPPLKSTGWRPLRQDQSGCRTTHAKNLRPLGSSSTGFSTLYLLLACSPFQ